MGHRTTMTEGEEFVVLPEDSVIVVECTDTEVKTLGEGDKAWEKLECKFDIVQAPNGFEAAVGKPIWGGVGFRLTDHVDNKLRQWIEALLGLNPSAGFEFDTDMFLGRRAKAVIGHYKTKNGDLRHQVAALIPGTALSAQQMAASGQAPAPQAQPQVQQPQPAMASTAPTAPYDDDVPF